jgi:hypothetical protein
MVVLLDRIGRALLGVLAAAGIVVALRTQYPFHALMLVLILVSLIVFTVWREQSRSTTRARDWLQRRDPSAVVFVSGRPSPSPVLDRYSTSESPLRVPALIPVVADAAGISCYSTERFPAVFAFIPWSSIDVVELSDNWADTKVTLLSLSFVGGHGMSFYVRKRVKGLWDVKSDSERELLREIEAVRPN